MSRKKRTAARVTIFDAVKMTKKGKRDIAAWLRRQAKNLEQYGQEMSRRFVARYLY